MINFTRKMMMAACAATIATAVMAKVSKPTYVSNGKGVIISKVYANITKVDGSAQWQDMYVEIFNNSHEMLDLSGLYLGLTDSESSCPPGFSATTVAALTDRTSLKDSVMLKQVFRIPESANAILAPGKSFVICNCAVNNEASGIDLSGADFEVKSTSKNYSQHNDAVPAMDITYTYNSKSDFMNLTVGGPQGVVLLAYNTTFSEDTIYGLEKTKGMLYIKAPKSKVLDGMEILKYKSGGVDETTKRLINDIDSGYVYTENGNNSGEVFYRKTAMAGSSRVFLFDTNNSTVDFGLSTTMKPREYDTEAYGTTDSVVTVPSTGYLAICPSKPFYSSSDVTLLTVNSSSKADLLDLSYNGYQADTCIAMATGYIMMAKPGDYTLKLSDWGATLSGSSSIGYAKGDGNVDVSVNKNRVLYTFTNTDDFVGFDSIYATTKKATYSIPANTLYITVTSSGHDYIMKNSSLSSLSQITWHGGTPGLVKSDDTATMPYTTYCDKYHALDFSNVSGLTAYYLKSITNDVATLQEISGTVAPGTPVIVKCESDGIYDIPYATEGDTISDNLLTAVLKATKMVEGDYQLFCDTTNQLGGGMGLTDAKVLTEITPPVFYLTEVYIPASVASSLSLTSDFIPFEEVTGIYSVEATKNSSNAVYNLQGQRVSSDYKGIAIKNGKKYMMK